MFKTGRCSMSIENELARIRQQMNEDFEVHCERLNAQSQVIRQIELSCEGVQQQLVVLQNQFGTLQNQFGTLQNQFGTMQGHFGGYAAAVQSSETSWRDYRRRLEQALDVVQGALLTGEIENRARFDRLEKRLANVEQRLDGAA